MFLWEAVKLKEDQEKQRLDIIRSKAKLLTQLIHNEDIVQEAGENTQIEREVSKLINC